MWEGSAAAQRSTRIAQKMARKARKLVNIMKWRKPKKRASHPGEVLLKEFLNPAHLLYRLSGRGELGTV